LCKSCRDRLTQFELAHLKKKKNILAIGDFWVDNVFCAQQLTWDSYHFTIFLKHLGGNEEGGVLNKDQVTRREEELCEHVQPMGGTS